MRARVHVDGSPISNYERTLLALRDRYREAVENTQKFDAKWNRINDEVNTKLDCDGVYDVVQRAKIKGESLALQDAMAAGKWWREKAVYLANLIQTEIMLQGELARLRAERRVGR